MVALAKRLVRQSSYRPRNCARVNFFPKFLTRTNLEIKTTELFDLGYVRKTHVYENNPQTITNLKEEIHRVIDGLD